MAELCRRCAKLGEHKWTLPDAVQSLSVWGAAWMYVFQDVRECVMSCVDSMVKVSAQGVGAVLSRDWRMQGKPTRAARQGVPAMHLQRGLGTRVERHWVCGRSAAAARSGRQRSKEGRGRSAAAASLEYQGSSEAGYGRIRRAAAARPGSQGRVARCTSNPTVTRRPRS